MKKDEIVDLISAQGWFDGIDEHQVRQVVERSHVKKYKAGEFIYMVGEHQDNLLCVLDGRVKVSIIGKQGEEFVLAILESGHWFGEGALDVGAPMPLEASVIRDAHVLTVATSVLDTVLDRRTTFYKNVLRDVIGRSKLLYKLVEILLFRPLHARVAARMLYLIDLYGKDTEEGILLPIEISQADFARMSGGSRQRVNQVFRQWSKDGIVTKKAKHYLIHDVKALQIESESASDGSS